MPLTTEHAVQPFVKTRTGRVEPDRIRLCHNSAAAAALAIKLVEEGLAVGAIALSRESDPILGEYEEPEVLARVGQVPDAEDDLPF